MCGLVADYEGGMSVERNSKDHFSDLTKMVPLTIEQLREMRGKWVWIVSPDKDFTVAGWAYVGKDHVFTYWEYEYDAIVGRVVYNLCDYGAWIAYAYPPANIHREVWVSVEERLPEDEKDGETVLVIVFGKPHENITLHGAIMTAGYFRDEGWILNEYPEWEGPEVTHWMPLPSPPAELEKRLRGVRA